MVYLTAYTLDRAEQLLADAEADGFTGYILSLGSRWEVRVWEA